MAQPIREYLRGRADTIKCLVGMVTQVGQCVCVYVCVYVCVCVCGGALHS